MTSTIKSSNLSPAANLKDNEDTKTKFALNPNSTSTSLIQVWEVNSCDEQQIQELKMEKTDLLPTQFTVAPRLRKFVTKHFAHIITYQILMFLLLCLFLQIGTAAQTTPLTKRWGGFNERPMTNKCYRQERTATLLALFFGTFGADQFYAHHWALAVFKLLTAGGLGLWSLIDVVLWIVGGVYATPGCPGGYGS
ncbi:hypothetical protein EG329_008249 [Mollisiaceae sp. DMI_Dod_QoI]|nr:hypothetical protein EG329_008249 [Helotiales sp. DMI_Dod_QoI]